jgi:L-asparaginase
MSMNNLIKIIATGGTFDKVYNPITGNLEFNHSHLSNAVTQARIVPSPVIETLMLMDSLDMTDEHREQILSAVKNSPQSIIVIIHGTDTMAATARVLGNADLQKTIVITGAMVPIDIIHSDADFNLGFALGCATQLKPGTYIAMNANVHEWNNVTKNRELGIFQKVTP